MTQDDYAKLDATALAALVHDRKKMPQDIVAAALEAIETLNPKLNAVVLLDKEQAMKQAAAVDRDAPLAGVPCLVKDNNVYVEAGPPPFPAGTSRARLAVPTASWSTGCARRGSSFSARPTRRNSPPIGPPSRRSGVRRAIRGIATARPAARAAAQRLRWRAGWCRSPMATTMPARSGCRRRCAAYRLKPSRGLVPIGPYFRSLPPGTIASTR